MSDATNADEAAVDGDDLQARYGALPQLYATPPQPQPRVRLWNTDLGIEANVAADQIDGYLTGGWSRRDPQ